MRDTETIEAALARIVRWSVRRDTTEPVLDRAGGRLTLGDAWALAWIVERGPSRLQPLARQLGVEPPTLTARVRNLVDAGLVERSVDPADRRGALVAATDAGRRTYRELHAARRRQLSRRLRALPEADVPVLARSLAQLADALETPSEG